MNTGLFAAFSNTPATSKHEDFLVANCIIEQMGGQHWMFTMVKARNFAKSDRGVSFDFGDATLRKEFGTKYSHVKITLDANDTYSLEFTGPKGAKASLDTIYDNMLKTVFERVTYLLLG